MQAVRAAVISKPHAFTEVRLLTKATMKTSFNREQAARCRRLAIASTDQVERSRLVRLAEKYEAKADAEHKTLTASLIALCNKLARKLAHGR